jgi:hypothetical protein
MQTVSQSLAKKAKPESTLGNLHLKILMAKLFQRSGTFDQVEPLVTVVH